jgi:hypothetical protein
LHSIGEPRRRDRQRRSRIAVRAARSSEEKTAVPSLILSPQFLARCLDLFEVAEGWGRHFPPALEATVKEP